MFSGIIKEIGEVVLNSGNEIRIKTNRIIGGVKTGSSVSISGVCLTVKKIRGNELVFKVMAETLRKTILRNLETGDKVNLEFSLRVGGELGGHFVYGHVDGVGKVISIRDDNGSNLTGIKPPFGLMKYIVPRGSVAVDGVSLTVAKCDNSTFTVSLVEYTLTNTTLGLLKVGDMVNIEADMLFKYCYNLNKR